MNEMDFKFKIITFFLVKRKFKNSDNAFKKQCRTLQ